MERNQTLDSSFSRDCRIRKHHIYQMLFRKGRRIALPHFVIYYLERESGVPRLGTTVSRKVGNAVVRNRCKRQLREFFRSTCSRFNATFDISILARPGAAHLTTMQVRQELLDGLASASLVDLP